MASSGMEELTCYSFRFSPFVHRVEIALKEKSIPHKVVMIEDLYNKPNGLLEANPLWKTVPAITHRGGSVAESRIILEYLEEAFPENAPLMPQDAVGKAKVRFWANYVEQMWTTVVNVLMGREKLGAEELTKYFKVLNDAMMDYSADGPFFTGDKFGFLDAFLGPTLCFLKQTEISWAPIPGPEEIPRFHKWAEAMKARRSVSDTLPSNEQFVEYFHGMKQRMAAKAKAAAPSQ